MEINSDEIIKIIVSQSFSTLGLKSLFKKIRVQNFFSFKLSYSARETRYKKDKLCKNCKQQL